MNHKTWLFRSCSYRSSVLTIACFALCDRAAALAQCAPASTQKVVASNGAANDGFGWAVDIEGSRAVVGARFRDTFGADSGAVYSFTRTASAWTEAAVLTASDAASGDNFGNAVEVSGPRTVVGAISDADQGANTGSAYVFYGALEEAKLVASDAAAGDIFAVSVAIDGHRVVIGASGDDDLGSSSGSAYIFEWTGSQWLEAAKLHASDGVANDRFGASVAISGDYVIVGATGTDQGASQAGSAYVFEWNGSTWVQLQKLVASDPGAGDDFGRAVDIDYQRAIVGAPLDALTQSDDGSAYIFTRSGSTWSQTAKLVAADTAANRNFGRSVSLSGSRALIAGHLDNAGGATAGAAYAFELIGPAWKQRAKLVASDAAINDNFGASIAADGDNVLIGSIGDDDLGSSSGSAYFFAVPLSWTRRANYYGWGDKSGGSVALYGNRAAVGAPEDSQVGFKAGSVRVLDKSGANWNGPELHPANGDEEDEFGSAVALGHDCLVVGAPGAGPDDVHLGAAYVFEYDGSAWTQMAEFIGSYNSYFGSSVALSSSWLVVGAPKVSPRGAAFVYERDGSGSWTQFAQLTPTGGSPNPGGFGGSVAVCEDDVIVVGASGEISATSYGSAYVFEWNGTAWTQTARLEEGTPNTEAEFGHSVAVSGGRLLIGAPRAPNFGLYSGAAFLYTRSSSSVWLRTVLGSGVASAGDCFGSSVSLWGDRAVIGARCNGIAWVLESNGNAWVPTARLEGPLNLSGYHDNLGEAVAIEGDRVICGSPMAEEPGWAGSFIGAAFFFEADCPGEWIASYCTAGTTSSGCNAHITGSGAPSASNATPFDLLVSSVEGQKSGHVFYGMSGSVSLPWGSTGYLCVRAPTQRTAVVSSGGTAGACDGVIVFPWSSLPAGSLGAPFCSGDTLWAQCWFRDPPSPKTTALSDALQFTLLP